METDFKQGNKIPTGIEIIYISLPIKLHAKNFRKNCVYLFLRE